MPFSLGVPHQYNSESKRAFKMQNSATDVLNIAILIVCSKDIMETMEARSAQFLRLFE